MHPLAAGHAERLALLLPQVEDFRAARSGSGGDIVAVSNFLSAFSCRLLDLKAVLQLLELCQSCFLVDFLPGLSSPLSKSLFFRL